MLFYLIFFIMLVDVVLGKTSEDKRERGGDKGEREREGRG